MRVCILAWDYPPSPSGLSTAAREVATSLAEAGCDVTVVTLDRSDTADMDGVRVVGAAIETTTAAARLRRWGGIGHLAAPLAFRRAVAALHRANPFDILEATNWYAPAALLGLEGGGRLVSRMSTPAAYSRSAPRSARDRLDAMAADALERRQVRHSCGLISNAGAHARLMETHYALDGTVPHAVIGLSLPPDFAAEARAAPFAPTGPVRLLFVGRAEERKGFAQLLAAVRILAAEAAAGAIPDFTLRLLGVPETDLAEDLPEAARARIVALGRQPQAVLLQEYAGAHIVVAPSRYESFGLVYQEALAFGRVVVASAADPSARDFVTEGGVLASDTTAEAIAEALRPLIISPQLREDQRQRALKAAGRFDRASLAAGTMELYGRALDYAQGR